MKTLLSITKIAFALSLLLTVLAGLTCIPKGSPFKFQVPLEKNLESNLLSNLGQIYSGNKPAEDAEDDEIDRIKAENEEYARTRLGGTGLAVGPEKKLEDADKNKPRVYVWGRKPYIEGTLPEPPGLQLSTEALQQAREELVAKANGETKITDGLVRQAAFSNWLQDEVDALDNDRRNNLRKLDVTKLVAPAAPVVVPKTNPYFAMNVSKGAVALTGSLPSEDARRLLVTSAQTNFKGRKVTDNLSIDADNLNSPEWIGQTANVVGRFSSTVQGDTGFLGINKDRLLEARGSAKDVAAKSGFTNFASTVPGLSNRSIDLTVPAPKPAPIVRTNPHFVMNVSKGGVELTGDLPSEDARRLLVTSAEANFKGRSVTADKLSVNTKTLNAPQWVGQAGTIVGNFSSSVKGDTGYLGINKASQLTARGSGKAATSQAGFARFASGLGFKNPNVDLKYTAPAPPPVVKTNPYFDMKVTKPAVNLVGELPTAAAKAALAKQAKASFPGRTINDQTTVNATSLNARPWVGQAGPTISQFATTVQGDTGRLSISKQNQLVAVGSCKNQAAYDKFAKHTAQIRGVKSNLTGLKVPPPPKPKSPSHYMVKVGENAIRLDGLVPTDATKSSLAASTKRALPTRTGSFVDNTTSGGAPAAWVPGFTSLISSYGSAVDAAGGTVGIDSSGNVIVTGVAQTKAGHNSVNALAAAVPGSGADTTGWTFTPPPPPEPVPAPVVERPKPKPLPTPELVRAAVDNRLLPTIQTTPLEGGRREPAPAPDGPGTVREIRNVPTGRIIQVPTGDGQWRTVDRPPENGDWRTIEGAIQPDTYRPSMIRPSGTLQTVPVQPLRTVPFRGTTQPIRGTSTSGDWRPVEGSGSSIRRGTGTTSGNWVPVSPGAGGPRVVPMAETTSVRPTPRTIPITQATTPASVATTSSATSFGGVSPRINISRGAGNWAVSGVVPSQSDSDNILSAVTRSSIGQGGAQVVDRIKVDPAATRSAWVGAYASMLSAMREVQDAQLNVDGNRITLRGKVSSEERKAAVAGNVRSRLGDASCVIQNDLQAL